MRYFYFPLLLLLFTCSFTILKSQENYVNGYIIKNSGDTLTGFIKHAGGVATPSVISFKTTEDDMSSEFKPSQLKEFCAKDNRYVSSLSEVLTNATDIENLEYDPGIKTRVDSIFLEIMIQGHKSLFYHKSPEGTDNFYVFHNNSYQLLSYKKYYNTNNGIRTLVENNRFYGQLGAYLNDCKKIQNYLRGVNYNKESLRILFLKYYECNPSDLTYLKDTEELPLFPLENFLKGYIINGHGDTLHGWIDYHKWSYTPSKIKFRQIGKSSAILDTYKIREFGVNHEKYVSAMAEIEDSPSKLNELQKSPKLNIHTKPVFLQVLIEGDKSLLLYISSNGKENYYINQDSSVQLLIYKKYLKETHNADILVENKNFIGQINLYLANCNDIQKKSSKLQYTRESLVRIFHEYYACLNKDLHLENTEKTILEKGFLGGVTITNLKFEGSAYNSLNNTKFTLSPFFSTGVFLNAVFPKHKGRTSLANELIFTHSEFHGQSEGFDLAHQPIRTTTDIQLPFIKINNLFRYKLSESNPSFYVNIGLGTGFTLGSTIKHRTEFQETIEEWRIDHSKYELSYIIGGGLGYGNYILDLRIEKGSGFSFVPSLDSKTSRIYLLVGYKF